MPKPQKTDVIKFARLTWELVRRNSEYQENYVRFLNNEGLSPEDVKPKIREDGSSSRPWNLARRREADFDIETGRVVLKDEAPDPQRCNLAYMMHRWGFACDPDAPAPYGAYWCGALTSKEWLNMRKKPGPIFGQPLLTGKLELQKLPGVLEVNRWPEFCLSDENLRKFQEAIRAVMDGWKPKNEQEFKEYKEAINPPQWETEDPPCLTVTINLQAPSWLIEYALEILREVCKADLSIKEKKIEWEHHERSLRAWDLKQQGLSDDEINQRVNFPRYESGEHRIADNRTPEMIEADQVTDGEDQLGARLKKIEEKINRGSLF